MSVCTVFLRPCENPPNLEELKGRISSGSLDEKVAAVKDLIKCIISDETFPPIIMHIITNIIPVQHKSNSLRKVMLLYWEIVEKSKSPTDKSLKEEVFLACNSLRSDLIGHNEYLRGRTLRLLSRIMHRGVIEPLATAITNNLQHKSAYVRRNAVICLYNIHMHFGSDIVGEIDDEIEELLKTETDLSTKRNAFLLLHKSNPQLAMNYLETQVKNQSVDEIGDILQLAILKILKLKCKEDPSQKPRLLKIVSDFQEKASESVRLQCAITATAISNSASTIKNSLNAYVNILAKTSEINIKKIILDKLEVICKNSNYLQDDVIEDLLKGLDTPSAQIKIKIIDIVMTGVSIHSAELILRYLHRDPLSNEQELISKVLSLLELISHKYAVTHGEIVRFFEHRLPTLNELSPAGYQSVTNTFKMIFRNAAPAVKKQFTSVLLDSLANLQSSQLLTILLNQTSIYLTTRPEIEAALTQLKAAVGTLPLELPKEEDKEGERKQLTKVGLRNFLIQDSILGGVFGRAVGKMVYKIRKGDSFNKWAAPVLQILCSLLRCYQNNLCFVDQAVIDQLTVIIRRLVAPQQFISTQDKLFTTTDNAILDFTFNDKQVEMIEKNPEDLIHFRLLKKGEEANEFDYDEEEVNDILETATEKVDYISKLRSMVQLTGSFDPIYAESFIRVNKYDLFFEILMINNTKSNLLNVQIEFTSNAEVLVLEKAQSVNLRPHEAVMLRSHLRFSQGQFGIIYGYINYDSQAGLEQPYIITEEVNIDYMQFVQPATITENNFKIEWQRAQNEVVYQTTIPLKAGRTFKDIIQIYEKIVHAKLVGDIAGHQNEYFLNCHLFGKSKLGENFYINLALFAGDDINLSITIRSRDKAVRDIIYKQLLKRKFVDVEQEDQQ